MIELVGLVGLMAFAGASGIVGVRILLLAWRTRQLPEMTIGASLVLAGAVGSGLSVVPSLFREMSATETYLVYQLASALSHIGFLFLYVFVWRVFRPQARWAAVVFGVATSALVLGGVGIAVDLEVGGTLVGSEGAGGVWFWLSLLSRFVVYSWAALESFHYCKLLKRRMKIGLADEELHARFYYWGVCTTAVVLIWLNLSAQRLLPPTLSGAWNNVLSALLGFVVAGSLWRAFFPRSAASRTAREPMNA